MFPDNKQNLSIDLVPVLKVGVFCCINIKLFNFWINGVFWSIKLVLLPIFKIKSLSSPISKIRD